MSTLLSETLAVARPLMRPASFADYEGIAALEALHGLKTKTKEEWTHLWTCNPAFYQTEDWPIGWVLEDTESGIVGTIGNIPFAYHFGKKTYTAAVARGWSVLPRYRGYSMWLLMELMRQPNVDFEVTTTPNITAAAVFARLGWSCPPVGRWDRAGLWVANYPALAGRYMLNSIQSALTRLVGWRLSRPPDSSEHIGARCSLQRGIELEWCDGFDDCFQVFWEELKEKNHQLFLAGRSQAELRWHYKYALCARRIWVLRAVKGRRMLAYAIFHRRSTSQRYLSLVNLVDFQALQEDTDICRSMLDVTLKRCRSEGVDVLENTGCWIEGSRFLKQLAPIHRSLKCASYLYTVKNPSLTGPLQNTECWLPTQYDGDVGL